MGAGMDASTGVSIEGTSGNSDHPSPRFNALEYLCELIGTGFNLFIGLSAAVFNLRRTSGRKLIYLPKACGS
jgi:hypothetical protein